jgi:hypothetical protein
MRRMTRLFVVGALLAAGCTAIGIAYAAIPNGNTIEGCYGKLGGVLRVIDTAKNQKCSAVEVPISWNQTGPPGPQGDPGTNGTNGSGLSGLERVYGDSATLNQTNGDVSSVAFCPAGKKAISGGYSASGSGSGGGSSAYAITQNSPATTNPKDGSPPIDFWAVTATITSETTIPANYKFQAVAICASVAG